jgi:succinoglycan biosynthesis protein ExoO
VSVITPAYKAARYIGQAIESVQAQTLTDWEMIIVDDASPDETAEVVKRYLDDPRIKLIRSERNRGECGARNLALEAAQGEWIAVLDADDWFAPERLEHLWRFAQEKGAILVADLQLQIDDNGQTYGVAFSDTLQPPTVPTRYSIRDYLREHIAIKPFFSRRHALDHNLRYPEGIVLGGDHIFQTQLQLKGAELWIVPEPNYYYRVHPTSMVSAVGRSVEKINTLFERLLQLDEVRNNPELIRCVQADWRRVLLADKYRRFAAAVKQRQWRVALEHFSLDTASMFLKRLPGAVYRRLWAREQLRNPRASG